MKTSRKKTSKSKARNKRATAETKTTVKRGKPTGKVATGVRAKAARRTAEGKFTRIIFNQIGGKEKLRFVSYKWKERDAFIGKTEKHNNRGTLQKNLMS